MFERIPFAMVELEVVKLYEKGYSLTNTKEIEKHFDFISSYIESCGWDLDSYTEELMGWNLQKNLN